MEISHGLSSFSPWLTGLSPRTIPQDPNARAQAIVQVSAIDLSEVKVGAINFHQLFFFGKWWEYNFNIL